VELGALILTFFDFERCLMLYVGLDIHTKRIAFCVLSEKGQLVQRGQVRGLEEVLRVLRDLPDRFEVCYEASCGYGHYHDLLKPLAEEFARRYPQHADEIRDMLAALLLMEKRPWRSVNSCTSWRLARISR
jgi:hypothetical protein